MVSSSFQTENLGAISARASPPALYFYRVILLYVFRQAGEKILAVLVEGVGFLLVLVCVSQSVRCPLLENKPIQAYQLG